ncbi:MAG TPA: hypothetical protein VGB70_12935 [Allosphingosinicella sp.]|jgi:hypothetical protein
MAKLDLPPGMTPKNTAGGVRYYWQPTPKQRKAGWKGKALGADPVAAIALAAAQNAEIETWLRGGAKPREVKKILRGGTLGALIERYRAKGYPSVKRPGTSIEASTQREYETKFKTLEKWGGDAPLSAITPQRVAVLRDALMKPAKSGRWKGQVRHTTAHATLRVARTLFSFAEGEGLIARGSNPFDDFKLAAPAPRDQIWSPDAREWLLATADGQPSLQLAVDLAFQIGQREADLLKLMQTQWVEIPRHKMDADVFEALSAVPVPALAGRAGYVPHDVRGIRLRQNKGKRWVEVPVVGLTRARIEAEIARARGFGLATLLFDEEHEIRPWSFPNIRAGQTRFIRRFADLRAAAIARAEKAGASEAAVEMAGLQYRDFRRTAVVHQGELALPDHLIAAITGHNLDETKRILDTYMPRTTGMAARAIAMSHARGSSQSGTLRREGERS